MNLATATPVEIDTVIAELEEQAWKQASLAADALRTLHYAVGDRLTGRTSWKMSDDQAIQRAQLLLDDPRPGFVKFGGSNDDKVQKSLDTITRAAVERSALYREINIHEEEFRRRGGWSRFHQLRSTANARLHASRFCSGLHRSNPGDLGWHPELSGKSEAEAVTELGPVMCSKCFRSAPTEWKQDPASLRVDPDACPGEGQDPVEGTLKRHSNYSGVKYYGDCPACPAEGVLLRSGNKLPKHKQKPKDK